MSTSSPGAPALLDYPAVHWHRGVRIRTALNRTRLTLLLAAGEAPDAGPELALRARQLTTRRSRSALARSLERAVAEAEDPRAQMSPAVPLARREVRAARTALRDLAFALRGDGPVSPQGAALTERLLTDGTSPLYVERTNDALWRAAIEATEALRV